jgi:hypothetical protein
MLLEDAGLMRHMAISQSPDCSLACKTYSPPLMLVPSQIICPTLSWMDTLASRLFSTVEASGILEMKKDIPIAAS